MAGIQIDGVNNKIDFDDDADTSISSATDDTLVVEVGGSTLATATATSLTINDGTTITTADNTTQLTLTCTDADADSGPHLSLFRNSGSVADNDLLGMIQFDGVDDGGNTTTYARFISQIIDAGDGSGGSEDTAFRLQTRVSGTLRSLFSIEGGTSGQGEIVVNDPQIDMDFRVESTGLTHALFVDAGNDVVGIGTSSPTPFRLHVDSNTSNTGVAKFNHSHGTPEGIRVIFSAAAPDNTSATFLECQDSSATRLQIQAQGNVQNHDNSYGQISDERIKQNITDANSQWDDIKALKVKNFERKDDVAAYGEGKKVQIGLIAQECEAVSPGLVNESEPMAEDIKMSSEFGTLNEDGTIKTTTDEKVKGISYSVLYMKAIKALQEAMAKIEALETSNTDLKNRVTALEG